MHRLTIARVFAVAVVASLLGSCGGEGGGGSGPPPLRITASSPPAGFAGAAYADYTFAAAGGTSPLSWSESGALPPGLTLSTAGLLSGETGAAATYGITVTVSDSSMPPVTASAQVQIVIKNEPFSLTGGMSSARESHTATLLNDGRVLVTGGMHWGPSGCGLCGPLHLYALASAEIYDPSTTQFARTGTMSVSRVFHTATLLANGKVLITGGDNRGGTVYATAELFDPATGSFVPTGSMVSARSGHTATALGDGKVLVAGGDGGVGSAELFDPGTGEFTQTGRMTSPRFFHTATLLTDGRVLIAGGDTGTGVSSTAELYNPATGTFAPTGSMSVERAVHRANLLANGAVLVTGGSPADGTATATAEIFNPVSGKFVSTGNMREPRQDHTATRLSDGQVLVTGGAPGVNSKVALSSAELFDPATGTFADAGDMGTVRVEHTATLLTNGDVLIAGGINFDNAEGLNSLSTAELYASP